MRTGSYGDGLLNALELHFTEMGKSFQNENYSISYSDIQFFGKKYEQIIGKEFGNKLESGWGDVIAGFMILASGVAVKVAQKPAKVPKLWIRVLVGVMIIQHLMEVEVVI